MGQHPSLILFWYNHSITYTQKKKKQFNGKMPWVADVRVLRTVSTALSIAHAHILPAYIRQPKVVAIINDTSNTKHVRCSVTAAQATGNRTVGQYYQFCQLLCQVEG